jgi:PAS domain S-box-containing protein
LIDGFDENGRCILWNKECERVFKWTQDEINAQADPLALFYPDPDVRKEVIDTVRVKPDKIFREWHPLTKDGKELITLWANFKLLDGEVINIGYDITDRKIAEEKIAASLKEKDVLLKEINHRVKNNLQIINSLYNLQAEKVQDEKTRNILKESQARVKSISLVHEKLYKSSNLAKIDVEEYIKSLVQGIRLLFDINTEHISIDISVEKSVNMGIDKIVNCGLIVNELITNAYKYAFPGERNGVIAIGLRTIREGEYELSVSDNGVGIPAGFNIATAKTLGLELVRLLANQMGSLQVYGKNGTTVIVSIKDEP